MNPFVLHPDSEQIRIVDLGDAKIDDDEDRQIMHKLYAERLGRHATTADAVWNSSRELLLERRAAGKSTLPWYWAGFVGSSGWE